MPVTKIHDMDRDNYFMIEDPMSPQRERGAVAYISQGEGGWFDRAAVADLIDTLAALLNAHDTEEARKAAEAAKEAAKLKRGDLVQNKFVPSDRRAVLCDEYVDPDGLACSVVDVVSIAGANPGEVMVGMGTWQYVRI